jgi:hypothetical protein
VGLSREANGYVGEGSKFLEPRASGNRPSHSRESNDETGALFTRVPERDGAKVASANDRDRVYAGRRPQNREKGVKMKQDSSVSSEYDSSRAYPVIGAYDTKMKLSRGRPFSNSPPVGAVTLNVQLPHRQIDGRVLKSFDRQRHFYDQRRDCRHGSARRSSCGSARDVGESESRHDVQPVRPTRYMKPDKYSGNTAIETYLMQFETVADYNGWSYHRQCAQLRCCLTGNAAQILWGAGSHEKLTYETLVARLQSRFGAAGQKEHFSAELRALRRKNGESLAELHGHVRRLMSLAYPESADSDLGEIIARDHFIAALNDRELELKVRDKDPPDLDSAFKVAVRAETHLRAHENERDQHRDQRNRRDRADDVGARQIHWPNVKQNFGADGGAPSVVEHLLETS